MNAARSPLFPLPRPARWALACGWIVAMLAFGCHPATGGDPEFWAPLPGGSSAAGGAGGAVTGGSSSVTGTASSSGTGAGPALDSTLDVAFTTVTFNGKYAPDNVGAVWVEDGQGAFVKTLQVWAVKRIKYLTRWKAASGGNVVDAVTGATRSKHGAHALTWDLTDVGGAVVPDGVYRVNVEFTEYNGAGKTTVIEFVKGPAPVDESPADLANFTAQHLTFTP